MTDEQYIGTGAVPVRRAPGRPLHAARPLRRLRRRRQRRRAATPGARRRTSTRSSSSRCRTRRPASPACRRASTTTWRRSSPTRSRCCEDYPDVNIQILPPRSYGVIILNTAAGLMSNVRRCGRRCRRRSRSCRAARPRTARATSSPVPASCCRRRSGHSEVSAELYNQGNPEKARQLLTEAGYDGTPVAHPVHPGGPRRLQRRRRRPAATRSRPGSRSSWRSSTRRRSRRTSRTTSAGT